MFRTTRVNTHVLLVDKEQPTEADGRTWPVTLTKSLLGTRITYAVPRHSSCPEMTVKLPREPFAVADGFNYYAAGRSAGTVAAIPREAMEALETGKSGTVELPYDKEMADRMSVDIFNGSRGHAALHSDNVDSWNTVRATAHVNTPAGRTTVPVRTWWDAPRDAPELVRVTAQEPYKRTGRVTRMVLPRAALEQALEEGTARFEGGRATYHAHNDTFLVGMDDGDMLSVGGPEFRTALERSRPVADPWPSSGERVLRGADALRWLRALEESSPLVAATRAELARQGGALPVDPNSYQATDHCVALTPRGFEELTHDRYQYSDESGWHLRTFTRYLNPQYSFLIDRPKQLQLLHARASEFLYPRGDGRNGRHTQVGVGRGVFAWGTGDDGPLREIEAPSPFPRRR